MTPDGVMESCLYANDLTVMEEFYSSVLGLAVVAREPGRHVFFRCGSSVVLVFNPAHTSTELTRVDGAQVPLHGTRGSGHLAFRVDKAELPRWREHLHATQVAIESEVTWPKGGASIYFRDPAGNSIELVTPETWRHGPVSDET